MEESTANTSELEEDEEENQEEADRAPPPATSDAAQQTNGHHGEYQSYVTVHGEWETRQISIIGVVKRFISQLSYGQDLTRISLPSEFLNPYSVLEMATVRYLTKFPLLLEANAHTDPEYRMLFAVRWLLASMVDAKMYKKPYNPVVGETHKCYIEDNNTGFGTTHFIAEQVTHHPPVSALHISNKESGVSVVGNISFAVKFWFNSVTINSNGFLNVKMSKHDELYEFAKGVPDLQLKNVVFGTRRMKWQNSILVKCTKTNCNAEILFDDSGNEDLVSGTVTLNGENVLSFEGAMDGSVYYRSNYEDDEEEDRLLLNSSHIVEQPIIVPPQTDTYPSIKIWSAVSQHIINNNMTEADRAKQVVEEEQRKRTKLGEDLKKERSYFIFDEETQLWVYKESS